MPLTSYVAGDVLTASSLNDNFTFAAANPSSGLTFITSAAFTTVTSFSLPDDTFDATYENYKLVVSITAVTNNADFTIRLRSSGSDNTTSNYRRMFLGITSTGSASNSTGAAQTSIAVGESNASLPMYRFAADILQPKLAQPTTLFSDMSFVDTAGSANFARVGTGLFFISTQFDSLSFISSVASSITGRYYVYGYANS